MNKIKRILLYSLLFISNVIFLQSQPTKKQLPAVKKLLERLSKATKRPTKKLHKSKNTLPTQAVTPAQARIRQLKQHKELMQAIEKISDEFKQICKQRIMQWLIGKNQFGHMRWKQLENNPYEELRKVTELRIRFKRAQKKKRRK